MKFGRDAWFRKFHDLMPFRIREVLVVSSYYDAFILEEDGRLTERLFIEYSELNLSAAPRITHTATADGAMELLEERPFDLVITMVRLDDMDVTAFGRRVKERFPRMPVILLAFSEAELRLLAGVDPEAIDNIFVWNGDARILLAIIKVIEDRMNVGPDTRRARIRVIIFVEDSVQRYSSFLSILYAELMTQSQSLIAEGVNDLHKRMRLHARPKLLMANTYEQALGYFEQYADYAFALISDIGFPREGTLDPEAGFKLLERIRETHPDLPVLLHSSEALNETRTEGMGIHFVGKKSEKFQRTLRRFIEEDLGFGSFIFRLPDRSEVARAQDAYEMEKVLESVPISSLEYHAARNDFSTWLMARSLFQLALEIKPKEISSFEDTEALRRYLIRAIRAARKMEQRGVITDFSPRQTGAETDFVRIGGGSIGGKARSVAFVNSVLPTIGLSEEFPEFEIKTPRTLVVATNEFDRFLEENSHLTDEDNPGTDKEILDAFLEAELPWELAFDLETACRNLRGPLAVRSSSLLEDSHIQPFAGIYSTYMLPNNHPDPDVRLREIGRAIKGVYASAFTKAARTYLKDTSFSFEDEKIGVAIQEIVGRRHGDRFYPDISGVALSYNYYPVGYQKPEDGIVLLALGMGHQVVSGGSALQFCPSSPGIQPQYSSAQDYLKFSQNEFYALDLERPVIDFFAGTESSMSLYPLSIAEEDGTLAPIASTYCPGEDRIRDTLTNEGPRIVTFRNILRWNAIPLAPALAKILRVFRDALGCAVEIEFCVNLGGWGSSSSSDEPREYPSLYILQIRPQGMYLLCDTPDLECFEKQNLVVSTPMSKGNGMRQDILDVVFVKPAGLTGARTREVAREVGRFNAEMEKAQRPYLLVGPGRWGSSDPYLGIPVEWRQISGAAAIVEMSFEGRVIEPSQGSHFFHNLMSRQVGYLTIPTYTTDDPDDGYIDMEWLKSLPAVTESDDIRHLRLEEPVTVHLDGRTGRGTVLKPGVVPLAE